MTNQITEERLCNSCNKPIVFGTKGSFTSWIFRSNRCLCKTPNVSAPVKLIVDKVDLKQVAASLPQYDVLDVLGEGGMGFVYKVRDRSLDKVFALKVLKPEFVQDSEAVKRFEKEADATMQMSHPNLVAVYKRGVTDHGLPYLLMEYIEGETLADLLGRETAMEPRRCLNILQEILEAMEFAHSAGIIHRDLKPSNIMIISPSPGIEIVKVVDFGIARVLPKVTRETLNLTKKGEVFGSPSYMSPEQCMGESLDERADIYSLGCLMYEALSGQPPFKTDNNVKTIMQQLTTAPAPFANIAACPVVPSDMEKLVMRCLEKSPKDRFQSVQEMKNSLRQIDAHMVSKPRMNASVAYIHRRRRILAITFLVLGLISCFLSSVEFYGESLVSNGAGLFLVICLSFWLAFCNYRQMVWCRQVNGLLDDSPTEIEAAFVRKPANCLMQYTNKEGKTKELPVFFRGGKIPKELISYFDGKKRTVTVWRKSGTETPVAVIVGKYLCITSTGPLQLPPK